MLFAINFQDDVTAFPPPLLELTGTVTGGLFERAQSKFQELWQQTSENPQILLTSHVQLDEILSHTPARNRSPADEQPRPQANGHAAAVLPPSDHARTLSRPGQTGDSSAPQRRRWPGRPD